MLVTIRLPGSVWCGDSIRGLVAPGLRRKLCLRLNVLFLPCCPHDNTGWHSTLHETECNKAAAFNCAVNAAKAAELGHLAFPCASDVGSQCRVQAGVEP